jgi:hypothetical protein
MAASCSTTSMQIYLRAPIGQAFGFDPLNEWLISWSHRLAPCTDLASNQLGCRSEFVTMSSLWRTHRARMSACATSCVNDFSATRH